MVDIWLIFVVVDIYYNPTGRPVYVYMHVFWVLISFKIESPFWQITVPIACGNNVYAVMQTRSLYGPLEENRSLFFRLLIGKPSCSRPVPKRSIKVFWSVPLILSGLEWTRSKKVPVKGIEIQVKYRFQWKVLLDVKATFYWSLTFYLKVKSRTPVKSRLEFQCLDWYLFTICWAIKSSL